MPTVEQWMLGRAVTWVQMIPQTMASDGTLAPVGAPGSDAENTALIRTGGDYWPAPWGTGAFQSFQGLIDDLQFNPHKVRENISGVNRPRQNNVAVALGVSITLVEILRFGANNALLARMFYGANTKIGLFSFSRAGGKWANYYLLMQSYSHPFQRGKNTGRLTCSFVDAAEHPTYNYDWSVANQH